MDTTLTEQADRLLTAIKDCGKEWVKRTDIAKSLSKNSLSSGDLVLLKYLEQQGLIESVSVPTRAPSGIRTEYRVKP